MSEIKPIYLAGIAILLLLVIFMQPAPSIGSIAQSIWANTITCESTSGSSAKCTGTIQNCISEQAYGGKCGSLGWGDFFDYARRQLPNIVLDETTARKGSSVSGNCGIGFVKVTCEPGSCRDSGVETASSWSSVASKCTGGTSDDGTLCYYYVYDGAQTIKQTQPISVWVNGDGMCALSFAGISKATTTTTQPPITVTTNQYQQIGTEATTTTFIGPISLPTLPNDVIKTNVPTDNNTTIMVGIVIFIALALAWALWTKKI